MIRRWVRYVSGSYPPLLSVAFAVTWAYGVSGLFAVLDPAGHRWRPDAGTALSALTLVVVLLMNRIVDDVRDLDYDRRMSPERPLARGAARVSDVLVLYAAGAVVALALNAGRGAALALVAVQIAWTLGILLVDRRWRWPDCDNLPLTLLISCPAQILLHLYLYAGYARSAGHGWDASALLGTAVVFLASLHAETARKLVRVPATGERTYVTWLGVRGAIALALAFPLASAALLLAGADHWSPWAAVALLPLALPAVAALRFRRPGQNRWKGRLASYYLLATLASYGVTGALASS